MYLRRNITYECMNVCCVSQSVIHHGVFKRKSLMEKEYFIEKGLRLPYCTSERLDKNYCQIQVLLRGTK